MPEFEYAPAPQSRDADVKASYGLFVDGEFVDPVEGGSFETLNPATEEVLSKVALATEADVDRAVRAARDAFERVWGPMPGSELAVLETLDNGKPIRESRDVDIPLAAAHFFYHAGWADKLEWAGLPSTGPIPQPLGVAGQVIPW